MSDQAGVARFLRETYPEVPFTTIDVERLYSAAPALGRVLADYDRHRDQLAGAITRAVPVVTGSTLAQIYQDGDDQQGGIPQRRQAFDLYDRIAAFYQRNRTPAFQPLTLAGVRIGDALRFHTQGPKASELAPETDLWVLYRAMFYIPEATPEDVDKKVELGSKISRWHRVDRARLWDGTGPTGAYPRQRLRRRHL